MIIDSLDNVRKYQCIHPLFGKAFDYITTESLSASEPGDYEIQGEELKAVVMEKKGKTVAESLEKFECHHQHIDIQVCIHGQEQIGWKPRAACKSQKGEYNAEKDVVFYNDLPDMYFQLREGQFAIFFPEDVHAPMISEGKIKKLVIKVRL